MLSSVVLLLEQSKTLKQNKNIKKSSPLVKCRGNKVGSFPGREGFIHRRQRTESHGSIWTGEIEKILFPSTFWHVINWCAWLHLYTSKGFTRLCCQQTPVLPALMAINLFGRVQGKSAWFSYDWRKSNYFHVPFKSDF